MQKHATKAVLITGIFALLFYPIAATVRAETETVFRVGTFDESSYEFKSDGIDYANPAQDPVFIAGKSEDGKDWFSFQPGSSNGKAGFKPWSRLRLRGVTRQAQAFQEVATRG